MSNEDKIRKLIEWLRDDYEAESALSDPGCFADALESLLDGSARLQAHRANAAVIVAAAIGAGKIVAPAGAGTHEVDAGFAGRVEDIAHALLAAERLVSK